MIELSQDQHVYTNSRNNQPVAYAKDGELVIFNTMDCYNNQVTDPNKLFADQFDENDPNNPATGPVFVVEAKPGDVLAVDILDIEVAEAGVVNNQNNHYPLPADSETIYKLSVDNNSITYKDVTWQVEPMVGVIGLPMDDDEVMPTMNVYPGGGNMDNRRISKGSTVYLPVRVDGGLLAMGDLHASMGDGEVCGNGLEIAGRVTTRLRVIKDFELNWPVIETSNRWYVNTCGETTDAAIRAGYQEMQRLIANAFGWSLNDTAIYMTLHGYLEGSQACLVPGGGGNSMRLGTDKIANKPPLIS